MNYFEQFDWKTMLFNFPEQKIDISDYHKILSNEFPDFLTKYINLPILQRLQGIGLLCGTDWTKLYKNRFYYSRLNHSIGTALIIWNFTHDKVQTISGLLHDISTPVFSHVSDFRKGDSLTQTVTEKSTSKIIRQNEQLMNLLNEDNILVEQIEDYHNYPIADNEIPKLSADRLEYMFPSGMSLEGRWSLLEIQKCYNDIKILKNEENQEELGFLTKEIAEEYCENFCMTSHILQLNENKLALQLLGKIMNLTEKYGILSENDFMTKSESQIIELLDDLSNSPKSKKYDELSKLFLTFKNMTYNDIIHSNNKMNENEYFCVNLKVKQRYVNPLVKVDNKIMRLTQISEKSKIILKDFIEFSDTPFGCVKIANF